MIVEVGDRLYRIEVPLPNSPLKGLNSYVLSGSDTNLVIDTGYDLSVCRDALESGLTALGIDLREASFLITHVHADHAGLVARLATPTSRIYFSRIDAAFYDDNSAWQHMLHYAGINGFPDDGLMQVMHNHPGYQYSPKAIQDLSLVDDGDVIEVGDYHLRCISTPGHTRGHICLYDDDKQILFSGDHVLCDITPHIESWSYGTNALGDYFGSLDRISSLPVRVVLPGHRSAFADLNGRIDELKEHHMQRADEIVDVLGVAEKNAYDVAAMMTWKTDCESWDEFPVVQKWFATGEVLAHLRYLESEGRVRRHASREVVTFSGATD